MRRPARTSASRCPGAPPTLSALRNRYPLSSNTCRTASPTGPRPTTFGDRTGRRGRGGRVARGAALVRRQGRHVRHLLGRLPLPPVRDPRTRAAQGSRHGLLTDDCYDNDVHHMGGSVLAVDMHVWAATMLAFVSRPPDPRYADEGRRDMGLTRLEEVEPFIHTWLSASSRRPCAGETTDSRASTPARYASRRTSGRRTRGRCASREVGEETWVLEWPWVRLRLTGEVPRGQVGARVCDVAPDGSSLPGHPGRAEPVGASGAGRASLRGSREPRRTWSSS